MALLDIYSSAWKLELKKIALLHDRSIWHPALLGQLDIKHEFQAISGRDLCEKHAWKRDFKLPLGVPLILAPQVSNQKVMISASKILLDLYSMSINDRFMCLTGFILIWTIWIDPINLNQANKNKKQHHNHLCDIRPQDINKSNGMVHVLTTNQNST